MAHPNYGDELLMAAVTGEVPELIALLKEGADPNTVHSKCGNSALYNAIVGDKLEAISVLLKRGADPNLRLTYRSPVDGRQERQVVALMYALSAEAATLLIEAGADVNAEDSLGITPLIRAAHRAKEEIVRVLLRAGADPRHRMKDGRTAVDVARAAIEKYESWVVGANRDPIAEKVGRLERICEMLTQAP